ncbi:MAG: YlmC/YmxH family sporulation protein [Ruminococcaceae bacterium]|nr:YlmC/YmxH family sporulation protein [Oscillospiraceae bacterium]
MGEHFKKRMTFCELFSKEVINVSTGERLGFICDGEFDTCSGEICFLCVPIPCKNPFLRKKEVRRFSYCDIVKFGDDTILIRCDSHSPVQNFDKRKNSCKTDKNLV